MFRGLLLLALVAMSPVEGPAAPAERAYSAFHDDPARRFDFWIGRWRVDLRARQDDGAWQPLTVATAHVYPVLDGKALLELWDSPEIVGYSLRNYDAARGQWALWLDWPQQNRSQVGALYGNFRHGRGAFEVERTRPDGTTLLSRYTFSDITPFSLRWDDEHSTDGGKTWSPNWIMEFTREAVAPQWPISHAAPPTLGAGNRCSDAKFRVYEPLAGRWIGEDGDDRSWALEAWRIIGGCAVIGLLEGPEVDRFVFVTYHTGLQRYELDVLDDEPGSALVQFYGDDGLTFGEDEDSWTWNFGEKPALVVSENGMEWRVMFRQAAGETR